MAPQEIKTPSQLNIPSLLVNFPFTVSNRDPNNVYMGSDDNPYNMDRAFKQFMGLYKELSRKALLYVLPSELDLQDLPYVANIGCYLPHIKDPTILISNFKSAPRVGEELIAWNFFRMMRYNVLKCPYWFEGEADLKYLKDNIYISCHGMRTSELAHQWMRDNFNMNVISMQLIDPKLYHLDCSLFVVSPTQVVATTSVLNKEDLIELEKHAEVISVPDKFIYNSWTNCVKIGNKVYHGSDNSNREIERFYGALDLELVSVELDEFDKSGADLSCLVMHLNYFK